jgi:selT/selW/selH-like putative selenoprotein
LAAEIGDRYPDARIELMPSSGGRFEVVVDGTPVFEKSKLRRHPDPGEILALIGASS